jgi:predicted ArsR family transcriptional regulator
MFDGVRRSYTLLVFLLMGVIEELGTDRSLEMLQNAVENQADIIVRELRKKIPVNLSPLETGVEVYNRFMGDAGAEVAIHTRDDSSVTFRVRRCPFYEAFLDVGVDCGYFLGGLCTYLTLPAIQAILTRFHPGLKMETKLVRESAEEFCLERIYLDEG